MFIYVHLFADIRTLGTEFDPEDSDYRVMTCLTSTLPDIEIVYSVFAKKMSIRKVQTYIREEITKNISASDFALQKSKMETEAGEAQLPGHLVESAD